MRVLRNLAPDARDKLELAELHRASWLSHALPYLQIAGHTATGSIRPLRVVKKSSPKVFNHEPEFRLSSFSMI